MNQQTANTDDGLRASLARFEDCVETPVMPGELTNWLHDAYRACDEVGVVLREHVRPAHAELMKKMRREDAELSSRVEQLQETERQVNCLFENVHQKLNLLTDRAAEVTPDEAKLDIPLSYFINTSLDFIVSARKQDNAITTWYFEAFNRDRGVGD
jgi:hypothetical protein